MGGWSLLPRVSDRKTGRIIRSCFAELFGTFSIVFWGAGAAFNKEMTTLHLAFGFGIGTAVTAHIFQDISGAHFNPAVSFALFLAQRISLVRCFLYWMMQFAGAVLAAALLYVFSSDIPGVLQMRKQTSALQEIAPWQGFLLEFLGTLAVVYTYLSATNKFNTQVYSSYDYPLALGSVVFLVHLLLVPLTGCGINPARAVMVNAIGNDLQRDCWVYIVGPLVASFLGAFSYELIFSFPLTFNVDESKTVDEKTAEVKAARKSVKNPKYEDIVMSNKINGTVAYD